MYQIEQDPMSYRDELAQSYARSMGRKSRAATSHEVPHKDAIKLYKKGLTDINIAAILGVSKGDVYRWRQQNGLISNMIRQRKGSTRSRKKRPPTEKK